MPGGSGPAADQASLAAFRCRRLGPGIYPRLRARRPRKRRPVYPRGRLGGDGLGRARDGLRGLAIVRPAQSDPSRGYRGAGGRLQGGALRGCRRPLHAQGHEGRGGWTWYTGSAGWMYQLLVEHLLGLKLEVDQLALTPLFHPQWSAVQDSLPLPEHVLSHSGRENGSGRRHPAAAGRRRTRRTRRFTWLTTGRSTSFVPRSASGPRKKPTNDFHCRVTSRCGPNSTRKVRGKWGLARRGKLVLREEKRCRHGACPLFRSGGSSKKGTGTVAGGRFITQTVNEATEPVPIFDCRSLAVVS